MILSGGNFRQGIAPTIDWQGAYTNAEMGALSFPPDLAVVEIYAPTVEDDKTYNFHPTNVLSDSTGRLHLAASCSDTDEEGPGQFNRYYFSDDDGATWEESAAVLIPDFNDGWTNTDDRRSPLPTHVYERNGVVRFIIDVVSGTGTGRAQVGLFSVTVANGLAGTPDLIHPSTWVAEDGYPQYALNTTLRDEVFTEISMPWGMPWGFGVDDIYPTRPAISEGELTEHSKIQIEGGWLNYARLVAAGDPNDSLDTWVTFSTDGVSFGPWVKTGMPNGNTKTCIRKISDRYVAICNSTVGSRRVGMAAYSADGITWLAANNELILDDTNPFAPVFAGSGKAGAGSYFGLSELPSGKLILSYSERGKEVVKTATWTPKTMT